MSVFDPLDSAMRQAAIAELERRAAGRPLDSDDLAAGFHFQGERIPFVNPQRGIFKPKAMRYLLSIRTVFPRTGARVWYDDQRRVHEQIHAGEELIDYAFMGSNPDAADNRWLKEAMEAQVPVILLSRYRARPLHRHLSQLHSRLVGSAARRPDRLRDTAGIAFQAGQHPARARAPLCPAACQPAPASGDLPRGRARCL